MPIIRKIKPADNAALANMIRQVFEEFNAPKAGIVYTNPTTDDLFTLFQNEKSVLWVAEVEGQVVGCCGIYPTNGLPENYAELGKFYLAQTSRGKGIGRQLMQKSVASAKAMGYTDLYLESLPAFDKAIRIYEKQGFVRQCEPLGASGHRTCNVWMTKKL